jgi:deoxyribodipyrimidine photolyase-related protein
MLAMNDGYIHHILRLMVVGNFMNLVGIHPDEVYKWFMEFSCDSYEWVMNQNVLDMVFCVTGGDTMRKPYISSSNYILKMSDYKKSGWCETWDALYWRFIDDHRFFFKSNPRMKMMVSLYDKKENKVKNNYIKLYNKIQKSS